MFFFVMESLRLFKWFLVGNLGLIPQIAFGDYSPERCDFFCKLEQTSAYLWDSSVV